VGLEANYDYKLEAVKITDKSNWIASITSLNGAMNGSTGGCNLDINEET